MRFLESKYVYGTFVTRTTKKLGIGAKINTAKRNVNKMYTK